MFLWTWRKKTFASSSFTNIKKNPEVVLDNKTWAVEILQWQINFSQGHRKYGRKEYGFWLSPQRKVCEKFQWEFFIWTTIVQFHVTSSDPTSPFLRLPSTFPKLCRDVEALCLLKSWDMRCFSHLTFLLMKMRHLATAALQTFFLKNPQFLFDQKTWSAEFCNERLILVQMKRSFAKDCMQFESSSKEMKVSGETISYHGWWYVS